MAEPAAQGWPTSTPTEDLFKAARAAYRLTLVGNAAPYVIAMGQRMRAPRPGDLVIEVSSRAREFDPDRVAILIAVLGEGCYLARPYEHQEDDQRWANAEFIAVPSRGEGWPS